MAGRDAVRCGQPRKRTAGNQRAALRGRPFIFQAEVRVASLFAQPASASPSAAIVTQFIAVPLFIATRTQPQRATPRHSGCPMKAVIPVLAMLALASCGAGTPVYAHEWFDPWCCNGKDCQPIPDSAVQITPQGYVITLRPGDHPMLAKETQTRTYRVPYANARVSLDPEQRFFACIYPDPSSMRCFYARPSGS